MSKKHKILLTLTGCLIALIMWSFTASNKYFVITQEDVVFQIPKGFPKPVYDLRNNKPTPAGFLLGRALFYDPILSADSNISCSFCHQRLFAFGHVDHRLSHGINGRIGKRNVPPLQNLAWSNSFMWDGGVNHLEVQPISPLTNPDEMGQTIAGVIARLQESPRYRRDFKAAFDDTVINSERMLKALTQFVVLMVSAGSRYDHFVNGEDTFSVAERRGLALFRTKCASCHEEPLFTNNKFMNNGLPPDTAIDDQGRGKITGRPEDNYRFKVPSLRNAERTYPYMHDGRFKTLKDVLHYYADPSGFRGDVSAEIHGIGVLSQQQQDDIYAFLLTLTDKEFIYDKRFIDPFIQEAGAVR